MATKVYQKVFSTHGREDQKKQQTILLYSERKKKSRSEFHPTILLVSAILHKWMIVQKKNEFES